MSARGGQKLKQFESIPRRGAELARRSLGTEKEGTDHLENKI